MLVCPQHSTTTGIPKTSIVPAKAIDFSAWYSSRGYPGWTTVTVTIEFAPPRLSGSRRKSCRGFSSPQAIQPQNVTRSTWKGTFVDICSDH